MGWLSKSRHEENGGETDGQNQSQSQRHRDADRSSTRPDSTRVTGSRDPDERTRLLQRDEALLAPDDPAVTPYNLWSVRALHHVSVFFLVLTIIWWVVLLVATFVTPPGIYTRGSGFFAFAYTTLTVVNLLIALMFFAVPSKPMTILGLILSVLLAVDMFVIVGVSRIRYEEAWVGVASAVWATLMGLYLVLQNRSVAWGKREEEERLTGREETRRSLLEWLAVLVATVILIVMCLIVILISATLVLRARDATLPPPGKRYWVGGHKFQVHLACIGTPQNETTTATILLQPGEKPVETGYQEWVHDAYATGTFERYCYFDRPGYAWSDNAPSPFSAGSGADALSEALVAAGEQGPLVVVSAGVGSIYSRVFTSRQRNVEGIFLIDPLHEDYLSAVGAPGRGFMLWLWGILSPLGLDRLAGAIVRGRTREDRVYGRSADQTGKYIKEQLQENLAANSITAKEIQVARNIQDRSTPLVVVSSGKNVKNSVEWTQKQEDLTNITNKLVAWDVVNGAPHEVWQTEKGRKVLRERLGDLVKAKKTAGASSA